MLDLLFLGLIAGAFAALFVLVHGCRRLAAPGEADERGAA